MANNDDRTPLPLDSLLDDYRIIDVLGIGGFAITYRAEDTKDTKLKRYVAIKEFIPGELAVRDGTNSVHPRSANVEETYQALLHRFLLEAQTLKQFRHPNIVQVLRYLELNATAYMVMEYEEGESLAQRLREHPMPDEAGLRNLMLPLLDGLQAVHKKGFLHRDIKPANIFIRRDGTPVLIDFGAARAALANSSSSLTVFYSSGYTPREQYGEYRSSETHGVENEAQGPWTDIYALAAVLYQAVSGQKPSDALSRQRGTPLPPAVAVGAARYSPRFLEAIDWGLHPDPQKRPQSVDEWSKALLANDASPETASEGVTQPRTGAPKPDAAPRQRWLAHPAFWTGVLAAFGAITFGAVRHFAPLVPVPVPKSDVSGTPYAKNEPVPAIAPASKPVAAPNPSVPTNLIIDALGIVDDDQASPVGSSELMLANLRADAQGQIIEKAIGIYVPRADLVRSYDSLHQKLIAHGADYIQRVVREDKPQWRKDGFVYLPITAEVRIEGLRRVLQQLSREERLALIRIQGDPLIRVSIQIRDAAQGAPVERSAIAENIVKERIRAFGFRVSATPAAGADAPRPDFAIDSEVKFKVLRHTLAASGITIEKYVLTSWTLKCVDLHSGEDVYFDNRVPNDVSWTDEDAALSDMGKRIGDAFSRDFFLQQLPRPSRNTRLRLTGVTSPAVAANLEEEFLSLRAVVNVNLEQVSSDAYDFHLSWYDQGDGREQSANDILLEPLQRKLGPGCLLADSERDTDLTTVSIATRCQADLLARLDELPRVALGEAPLPRLQELIKHLATMRKVATINPDAVTELAKQGLPLAREALPEDKRIEL